MKNFREVLESKQLLILDGAMGTQLEERAVHPGPEANLHNPDAVISVHKAYVDAGANVLLTNTLTANMLALTRAGLGDKMEGLNRIGVELARKAIGDEGYVLGDMSSTGEFLEPYGDHTEEEFTEIFSQQAKTLVDAGVDAIIVETMTDLREMQVAIRACKRFGVPVIATMSFDPLAGSLRTVMGTTPEQAAAGMAEAGADVIGSNCGGITPVQMVDVIVGMKTQTELPLAAEPNAGLPELIAGKVQFNLSPEDFAQGVLKIVNEGVQLVGGCCGTTPAHIAALAGALGV